MLILSPNNIVDRVVTMFLSRENEMMEFGRIYFRQLSPEQRTQVMNKWRQVRKERGL